MLASVVPALSAYAYQEASSLPLAKLAEARRPRAVDVLMALIEASGALVSEDELLSRARQDRLIGQIRQSGTRQPRCAKA
jgi:hypothetical protein